jgi:carbon storage regulator
MESGTMLVLSRKRNETIVIGSDVRITVVNIAGNQVRIGIDAPGDVKVMREELLTGRQAPEAAHMQARRRALAAAR